MCGITGWVAPGGAPIEERSLAAMTRALAHRGPDGEGLHLEPGCGLGHRRLSLLMAGADGNLARDRFGVKPLYYHVDAHGSLRFASELRALLAAPGVRKRSGSSALPARP